VTLTPDENKKNTTIDVYATTPERQALANLIKKVRERLIFDIDAKRLKKNIGAIQGAPDETGATDPLMYIKLDNFLKEFGRAIGTEAVSVPLDMGPNIISKESGDQATNRVYSRALRSVTQELDKHLIKRKDVELGGVWYPSKFEVRAVMDLSQMEGITSGEELKKMLKAGKVIPEYGFAKLPPSDRLYGLRGSKKVLANRAFVVIVEDTEEEGLTHDLQTRIKIDGGNYNSLVKFKKIKIGGVGSTTLNAYRENKKLKPKNKLELLQMAVALTVGMSESLISPRPGLKPQILKLEDPDLPRGDKRNYYVFMVTGYTGARTAAVRLGTEDIITGVQAMPEVAD
jgi:hypothetical protein